MDMIMFEGKPVVFRCALAMLALNEHEIAALVKSGGVSDRGNPSQRKRPATHTATTLTWSDEEGGDVDDRASWSVVGDGDDGYSWQGKCVFMLLLTCVCVSSWMLLSWLVVSV